MPTVSPARIRSGLVGTIPDTEYGFAIAGYVGVNLPMLGAGDALWLAATYADGAPAYLNGGNAGTIISPFAAFQGFTSAARGRYDRPGDRRSRQDPRLVDRRWPAPLLDPADPFERLRFVPRRG